jgi:hypothetical protein
MPFDPLSAIGVVSATDDRRTSVTGTCFLFRHDYVAITASHCVPNNDISLLLVFPRTHRIIPVVSVSKHPDADVAVLQGEPSATDTQVSHPDNAFWDCVANWGLGEEFLAYGFPEETNPQGAATAQPRLFVGHYQRFFPFESPSGFHYLAGEMSVPAPGGLSGGPLFRRGAPQMITGIVTTNHDSYTISDSVEEVENNGRVYRAESRRIISYGIALMLNTVKPWLINVVPEREGLGWIP